MNSWSHFEETAPELAKFGIARLHGEVSYIATVRRDGRPRLHPVTPIIGEGHLFLFMEPTSPKGHDLRRGSAYSLHSAVSDNTGASGEFQISGFAHVDEADESRQLATRVSLYEPEERYILFELTVEEALSTIYKGADIQRNRWRAGA